MDSNNIDPKKLKEAYLKAVQEHIEKVPGVCDKCGGRIEKRVCSLGPCGPGFSLPACANCGREYMWAQHATEVGFQEFEDMMNRPFTI